MTDYELPGRMRYGAIAALASASFVYFTAETLPVGLLPQIAKGLSVTPATVGLLVTVYAALAAIGAIPLTNATMQVPRHVLIVALVAIYILSQLLASVAPTFAFLVLARSICALAHGVFWSVMAPVAIRLAPAGQGGRASSLVMAGNTAGMVLGVPLSTILGQSVGWRASYAVLAVAGVLSAAALVKFLPNMPALFSPQPGLIRSELRKTARLVFSRAITPVCAVTTIVVTGQFAAYTYVAPIVQYNADLHGTALSVLLLGYGITGLIANIGIGRMVDKRPGIALLSCLIAMTAALSLLSLTQGVPDTVGAVLLWGAGFAAVPLVLQITAMRVSPGARDAASAVRQTAMQLGIAFGSLLGGALYQGNHLTILAPLSAGIAIIFIVVVLVARKTFPLTLRPAD